MTWTHSGVHSSVTSLTAHCTLHHASSTPPHSNYTPNPRAQQRDDEYKKDNKLFRWGRDPSVRPSVANPCVSDSLDLKQLHSGVVPNGRIDVPTTRTSHASVLRPCEASKTWIESIQNALRNFESEERGHFIFLVWQPCRETGCANEFEWKVSLARVTWDCGCHSDNLWLK